MIVVRVEVVGIVMTVIMVTIGRGVAICNGELVNVSN